MRAVVSAQWLEFTEPIEGGVANWYNDIRGLTTIAYGDLCNTPAEAAALPMVHPDGTFATASEKVAGWQRVHSDPQASFLGWRYAATLTPLRLPRSGMAALALRKLDQNDVAAIGRFPDWESYPACAQMALHSLWWACGPAAHFPRLYSAVAARDWDASSVEISMNEWTPDGKRNVGLIPRNVADRILMLNAQRVDAFHLDPNLLNWTSILGVSEETTQPDFADLCKSDSDMPPCLVQVNTPIMGQETSATLPTVYPRPKK